MSEDALEIRTSTAATPASCVRCDAPTTHHSVLVDEAGTTRATTALCESCQLPRHRAE